MTLYVIFPIHLNSPIRYRCVFKAIVHRRKQCIVLRYLSKFFFFFSGRRFYDIVQTCCIWLIFWFCHDLFLFFMFLYLYKLYLILKLNILFSRDSSIRPIKKGLIVETSLDLLYLAILLLFSSCYWLLLSNQNQSFYLFQFHNPTEFMTKKKIFLRGDLCVLHNVMLSNISFPGWHFPEF